MVAVGEVILFSKVATGHEKGTEKGPAGRAVMVKVTCVTLE